MNSKDDSELLKRLLIVFEFEAEEHIQKISAGLLALEKPTSNDEQNSLVEMIFREIHSFKGSARSVNLLDIEHTCQALESTFDSLKTHKIMLTAEILDSIHDRLNSIQIMLRFSKEAHPPKQEFPKTPVSSSEVHTPEAHTPEVHTPPRCSTDVVGSRGNCKKHSSVRTCKKCKDSCSQT